MKYFISLLGLVLSTTLVSQGSISLHQLNGSSGQSIPTAVPFLLISPDSRQGAMGDVGVATDPDVNSLHWNGSKLAFSDKDFGAGFTVTPWLRRVYPDINLYYVALYCRISKRMVAAASLRYFNLGNIDLANATQVNTTGTKPYELAADFGLAYTLSTHFSIGITTRYINSRLANVFFGQSANAPPIYTTDLSVYYRSNELKSGKHKMNATAGLAVTNIGGKMRYPEEQHFLPMNLRLGGGLQTMSGGLNKMRVYLDLNKLLVPTLPVYRYELDSLGNKTNTVVINPATGKRSIEKGKDPDVPVPAAILHSFFDSPRGFKGEIQEVTVGTGAEYVYKNTLSVRAGYSFAPGNQSSVTYLTMGFGFKLKVISVDGSYLISTSQSHPLQSTLRFTFIFNFDISKKEKTD